LVVGTLNVRFRNRSFGDTFQRQKERYASVPENV
jgi:hypothetical protein